MPRSTQLTLERLEDRHLLSLFGMPWSDAERLSLSFAPDGTSIDGQSSGLFQTLNASMTTSVWQREILRAFQTWAVQANINIGLVSDGGQAYGTLGAVQADSRFGDFRIGGRPQAVHLATNTPFNLLGNTRAGDVVFNTNIIFGINDTTKKDIFTVALNEAGNALGLIDSNNTASALYGNYSGIKTGLTAEDVAALRALYPARQADANEGTVGNDSFVTASELSVGMRSGDITTLVDADVFRFTVPESASVLSLRVQTGGISLLAPKLTIYDANQNVVSSAATSDPLTGQVVIELVNPVAGATYYAKVESGDGTVFGIGGYCLRLHLGAADTLPAESRNNVRDDGPVLDDERTNDSQATATSLARPIHQTDLRFDYRLQGKIRDAADVDYYRVTSPVAPAGKSNTLYAMVRGLDTALYSKVSVYDANGNLVNAEVLVNNKSSYTVQVKNAASDATYFIKIEAMSQADHSAGDYALGIDFRTDSTGLDAGPGATLSGNGTSAQSWASMDNKEDQLLFFSLPSTTATVNTAVRLTIYNSNNQVVHSVTSFNGEALSSTVFLAKGIYKVRFEAGAQNNAQLPPLDVLLRTTRLTDPIDPWVSDPTEPPDAPTVTFGGAGDTSTLNTMYPQSNPWFG